LVRREKYLSIKSEKNIEIKMIAVILYYTENSFRKTSKFPRDFEVFGRESLRL